MGPRSLGMGAWLTPGNTPLPPRVITTNFVAPGQTVWAQVGVPKISGDAGARPLGIMDAADPLETCKH